MSDQPTPSDVHIDTLGSGRRKGKKKMAPLTAERRNDLDASDFAIPSERRYPIQDLSHARNALARASGKPEEGTVRAAVTKKYPQLKKWEADQGRFWKDESQHLVYGVVLEPELHDSQGDKVGPDEIAKAAHDYLAWSRAQDVQHDGEKAPASVVESFIAPHDMVVGGEPVLKGAWVMVTKVHDDGLWDRVRKGELTGYSIEGTALRLEEAA